MISSSLNPVSMTRRMRRKMTLKWEKTKKMQMMVPIVR